MSALRIAGLVWVSLVLVGCGGTDGDELQKWMAVQKNQTRPKVVPIPEPKVFKPESYGQVSAVEPIPPG